MAEYGNNVHTTGDLRNGYRHVGVVDTVVGGGGLRYQQEQQSVAETAQSRYPPPGAVGDSQDQLNMIGEILLVRLVGAVVVCGV